MQRFVDRAVTIAGREYRYVVYVTPAVGSVNGSMPLVVFLHGSGECGRDNAKQVTVGLAPAILLRPEAWPCVVIFPQKPTRESQWEDYEDAVLAMVEAARKEFAIDEARISLTGLSQGGHGSWEIGVRHPELWAAVAPICGYGDAALIARRWKGTPVWAFHGLKDNVVPWSKTGDVVAALNAAGHGVSFTTYADLDHNSWDRTYRESGLAAWLLAQRQR